jgi:DNA-binding phage protein
MQKILTEKDVVQLLRREVAKAGRQVDWSRKAGLSRTTVNKVLQTRKRPTKSIIKALNLEIVYRLKEKAPPRSQD